MSPAQTGPKPCETDKKRGAKHVPIHVHGAALPEKMQCRHPVGARIDACTPHKLVFAMLRSLGANATGRPRTLPGFTNAQIRWYWCTRLSKQHSTKTAQSAVWLDPNGGILPQKPSKPHASKFHLFGTLAETCTAHRMGMIPQILCSVD